VSALLEHARENEVAATRDTARGAYYSVDGRLRSPDGRDPPVRVVWFIRSGEDFPRFVTAYPAR
jgi:hypothetical protein